MKFIINHCIILISKYPLYVMVKQNLEINLDELVNFANDLLQINSIKDYAPNGLQVEGKKKIKKIITGVTASLELIKKAIENKADAIIVHHGYFWKNEEMSIIGMKKNRIQLLLKYDISLLAYHLPLDQHIEIGNNQQLAKILGLPKMTPCKNEPLIFRVALKQKKSLNEILNLIHAKINQEAILYAQNPHLKINEIAICTGGAQSYIDKVFKDQAQLFISGEVSEPTYHFTQENDIAYISAGHHATERYGVQALASKIQEKFGIEHQFIDCFNPI